MAHRIDVRDGRTHAVKVADVAPAGGYRAVGCRAVPPNEGNRLMTVACQGSRDRGSQKPGSAGDQDTHVVRVSAGRDGAARPVRYTREQRGPAARTTGARGHRT